MCVLSSDYSKPSKNWRDLLSVPILKSEFRKAAGSEFRMKKNISGADIFRETVPFVAVKIPEFNSFWLKVTRFYRVSNVQTHFYIVAHHLQACKMSRKQSENVEQGESR